MNAHREIPKGGGRPRRRAGEGGFLLVMVMVVMLVLSTIAASMLINSFLEQSLAKNQNFASIALQAAEGGLAAGVTWLRENRLALPNPYTTDPDWEQTLTRDLSQDLNGDGDTTDPGESSSYALTIRFKSEWLDVNGDGDCTDPGESSGYTDACTNKDADGNCIAPIDGDAHTPSNNCVDPDGSGPKKARGEVVLYNKCSDADNCFDFPDSLYSGTAPYQGYPVIEIDAVGTCGNASYREIVLDLARDRIDLQADGAITARGNISISGSGYVDGHGWNMAGTAQSPDASCPDQPAITVDNTAGLTYPACAGVPGEVPAGSNPKGGYGGDPCMAVHDPTAPGKRALSTTPWDVIGIPETVFNAMFTPMTTASAVSGTAAIPTYIYQQADMHINGGSGYGMLVVHNPAFIPDTWATNCPSGVTGAGYCTTANGPATFFMNGNVTYTGVIIADQVLRVNGNATTIGAIITLGGANVDGNVTGNWTAKYSCESIENALSGFGYNKKLAWHRVR